MTAFLKPLPDWFETLSLKSGAHSSRESGMCVMEAAAYLAGRPHSDKPTCVSSIIGAFLRNWNDNLPDDASRNRLLKPLLPLIIGTAADEATERRRSFIVLDWLIREHVPAWFVLTPKLQVHADALRGLAEIVDMDTARAAGRIVPAARDAAWDAAWAAAWAAAGAAARDAAWDAAWAAAWAAAGAAARDAAWDAAWDAAVAAAWDAAWAAAGAAAWAAAVAAARAAARDAARGALKPTTERLQASAVELVKRLCAVTP